jgi:hypothetical protein
MVAVMAPAAAMRAALPLRPLSAPTGSALYKPHRRSFVLRPAAAARAGAPPPEEEQPAGGEMARGMVLGALLGKMMAGPAPAASRVDGDAEPAPKPAGVLGAALAALMMVRAAAAARPARVFNLVHGRGGCRNTTMRGLITDCSNQSVHIVGDVARRDDGSCTLLINAGRAPGTLTSVDTSDIPASPSEPQRAPPQRAPASPSEAQRGPASPSEPQHSLDVRVPGGGPAGGSR